MKVVVRVFTENGYQKDLAVLWPDGKYVINGKVDKEAKSFDWDQTVLNGCSFFKSTYEEACRFEIAILAEDHDEK